MLGDSKVRAIIAVKDMEAARKFYGETLGLKEVEENYGGVVFESGGTQVFVYTSDFAGTNKATSACWTVADIDAVVAELRSKGVTFEHYEMPGARLEGDVHVMEGNEQMKSAWFKDPEGNILALNAGTM